METQDERKGEFNIGRFAELNCISANTLRLYHEKGLLVPARVDDETGYRYYTLDQCSTLDIIQELQSLGVSLEEIRVLLEQKDLPQLQRLLASHLNKLEKQMLSLSIARQNARQLLESYQILQNHPICDQVIIERAHERSLIMFDVLNPNDRELTSEGPQSIYEWELTIRYTKRQMIETGIPLSLFNGLGCHIDRENLIKRDFIFSKSFLVLEDPMIAAAFGNATMPAGYYLTPYKSHYLDAAGNNEEFNGLNQLLDYADANNLTIAGDYYGEIVAETPAFLYHGRDGLVKLQVPITQFDYQL